jgi:hypothetical protein
LPRATSSIELDSGVSVVPSDFAKSNAMPTEASPEESRARMARRVGSASAAKVTLS